MSSDINVLALVKGEERYVVLFNDDKKGEALRTLGRYASNPELSFSWYDAAVLSQKVRNLSKQDNFQEEAPRFGVSAVEDLPGEYE